MKIPRAFARLTLAAAAMGLLPMVVGARPADAGPALGDGAVLLYRHADAPGVGDPPGFRLADCATQRNLGEAGRAQAKRLGEQLRARQIVVGEVRSSQWCRTLDTARLAFPGTAIRSDPDFNSFFGDASSEPAQTARALETVRRWRGPGVLVVVTHQVNITALTGVVPASGEGVVVRPVPATAGGSAGARLEVVSRLPTPR